MRTRRLLRAANILVAATLGALCFGASAAMAGTILNTRSALDALLGGGSLTENFETFDLGGAPFLQIPGTLDSSTVIGSQGPGLVVDGVRFTSQNVLEIADLSFLGQTNVLSVAGSGPRSLTIDFTNPVDAFGFDYFPTVLTNTVVTLDVFGADDSTVLETDLFDVFFFLGNFLGISDDTGIGKVVISSQATIPFNIYDTQIDNLTFGKAVATPEPTTLALFGTGLAGLLALGRKRRRKGSGGQCCEPD